MEKNCENKCENCPIRREWVEQVDETNYDITFLGDAVAESQNDEGRAINAFVDIAGEAAFLGKNWDRFKEAAEKMDYDPSGIRQLASELLDQLHSEGDNLRDEIAEVAQDCPGPTIREFEVPNARIIARICMSPAFIRTDGIEPVHVQRIPKDG